MKPTTTKRRPAPEVQDQSRILAERMQALVMLLGNLVPLRDPTGAATASEMTGPQVHTLMLLGMHPEIPMSRLANFLHCTGATCTGIADRLERGGYVERVRSDKDRRLVILRLTPKGEEQTARVREQMVAHLGQTLELLCEADRIQLLEILERAVAAAMERVHARAGGGSKPAAAHSNHSDNHERRR